MSKSALIQAFGKKMARRSERSEESSWILRYAQDDPLLREGPRGVVLSQPAQSRRYPSGSTESADPMSRRCLGRQVCEYRSASIRRRSVEHGTGLQPCRAEQQTKGQEQQIGMLRLAERGQQQAAKQRTNAGRQ